MTRMIYLLQSHYYDTTETIGAYRTLKRAERAMKELVLNDIAEHAEIIEIELED